MNKTDEEITEIMLGMVHEKAAEIYSKKIISHGLHPTNYGMIDKADGHGSTVNACGETIDIYLTVRNNRIDKATFTTDGCLFTIASCSAAAYLATGKTIGECIQINQSAIMVYLEGLPLDEAHCAYDAAVALHKAIRSYAMAGKRYNPNKAYV